MCVCAKFLPPGSASALAHQKSLLRVQFSLLSTVLCRPRPERLAGREGEGEKGDLCTHNVDAARYQYIVQFKFLSPCLALARALPNMHNSSKRFSPTYMPCKCTLSIRCNTTGACVCKAPSFLGDFGARSCRPSIIPWPAQGGATQIPVLSKSLPGVW